MTEITDKSKMPFGQYKGALLANVPAKYLLFLLENNRAGNIKIYIERNKEVLLKEAYPNRRK